VTIVFYVSGHGFGHATRVIETINAIVRLRPDVRIVARTSVPRWVFDASARTEIVREPVETDSGVVQIDSLRLDEAATVERASRFYSTFGERVEAEVAALRRHGAAAIVGDIPPLAFAAAASAGIPSVALANFTWDWIYEAFPNFSDAAPGVLETIGGAYANATLALRLPLHGGFRPMSDRLRDIPFVARHAKRSPEDTRRLLGLGGHPIVLASFGGHTLDLPYGEIARHSRYTIVVTDHESSAAFPRSGLRCFTYPELQARQLSYPDLVGASDVVVSKPGYGIVSECIANGAALLYTDRGRFAEQEVFVAEMPRLLRCRGISREDLVAGRWDEHIGGLLAQPPPRRTPSTRGAERAAQEILAVANRR
jgi:L-arabinokinase